MSIFSSKLSPSGELGLRVFRSVPAKLLTFRDIIRHGLPNPSETREVNLWRLRNLPNLFRGFWKVMTARFLRIPHFYGAVSLRVTRSDGEIVNLGLASLRVVTNAGVAFIVDAFQNTVELENMKYHGYGTGTNAEAVGDTALQTELTTQYASNNTRPTGSTTEGATANIYRSVGTVTPDASVALTEHGIFDQASNAGGVLLDRSVFSAVNLNGSGDSLQSTYDLTFTAGS